MKNLLSFLLAAAILATASFGAEVAALVGQRVEITVEADGSQPFGYQWRKNGIDIPGATAPAYVIASVKPEDAANYSVLVSNRAGSTISDYAALTVIVPPTKATTSAAVFTPPNSANKTTPPAATPAPVKS